MTVSWPVTCWPVQTGAAWSTLLKYQHGTSAERRTPQNRTIIFVLLEFKNVSKVTHFVNKCISLPPNFVSRSLAGISAQMSGMSQKQADDASFQKSLSCPDPLSSKCLQNKFLWGREGALEPPTCHRCMIKLTSYHTFLNGAPQWHLLLQKKKSHRSTSDIRGLIGESNFIIKTYQAHAWI